LVHAHFLLNMAVSSSFLRRYIHLNLVWILLPLLIKPVSPISFPILTDIVFASASADHLPIVLASLLLSSVNFFPPILTLPCVHRERFGLHLPCSETPPWSCAVLLPRPHQDWEC
jgi:hypothetical protein